MEQLTLFATDAYRDLPPWADLRAAADRLGISTPNREPKRDRRKRIMQTVAARLNWIMWRWAEWWRGENAGGVIEPGHEDCGFWLTWVDAGRK